MSRLWFLYMDPVLRKAARVGSLAPGDSLPLAEKDTVAALHSRFESLWRAEVDAGRDPKLWRIFVRGFSAPFVPAAAFKFGYDVLQFAGPTVLHAVVTYMQGADEKNWWASFVPFEYRGYYFAGTLLCANLLATILLHQYFHRVYMVGMNLRSVTISSVYSKSLRLDSVARQQQPVGTIVNLMSADATRMQDLTTYLAVLWSGPIQITIAMVLLWRLMGVASLAGFGVAAVMGPMNAKVSMRMKKLQKRVMEAKDVAAHERDHAQHEARSATPGRSPSWAGLQAQARDAHAAQLHDHPQLRVHRLPPRRCLCRSRPSACTCCLGTSWMRRRPSPVPAVQRDALACHAAKHYQQRAGGRWPLAPSRSSSRRPRSTPPLSASIALATRRRRRRLGRKLALSIEGPATGERTAAAASASSDSTAAMASRCRTSRCRWRAGAGCGQRRWQRQEHASARSWASFTSAGRCRRWGTVAYAPQTAFTQRTLRENAALGLPFDARYAEALTCCLQADIDMLPAGDETEIGEQGINLSGGQRQRVSMARAVYRRADTYLLDDVLSAVDAHVGAAMFEKAIQNTLVKRGATVVLVTHGMQYVKACDTVIALAGGRVTEQGSFGELTRKGSQSQLNQLLATFESDLKSPGEGDEDDGAKVSQWKAGLRLPRPPRCGFQGARSARNGAPTGALIKRGAPGVSSRAYRMFVDAGGPVGVLVGVFTTASSTDSQNWWLTFWSDDRARRGQGFYLGCTASSACRKVLRSSTSLSNSSVRGQPHARALAGCCGARRCPSSTPHRRDGCSTASRRTRTRSTRRSATRSARSSTNSSWRCLPWW